MVDTVPVTVETVDMGTGKVTKTEKVAFTLMPAPAGTCAKCGTPHAPGDPHNAQSLRYQYDVYGKTGEWPTWAVAMEHCSDDTKQIWTDILESKGVDIHSPNASGENIEKANP